MATTLHIPKALLAEVDKRAGALRLSRSGFIARALERALESQDEWSPAFLQALDTLTPVEGVEELFAKLGESRRSKGAPKL